MNKDYYGLKFESKVYALVVRVGIINSRSLGYCLAKTMLMEKQNHDHVISAGMFRANRLFESDTQIGYSWGMISISIDEFLVVSSLENCLLLTTLRCSHDI